MHFISVKTEQGFAPAVVKASALLAVPSRTAGHANAVQQILCLAACRAHGLIGAAEVAPILLGDTRGTLWDDVADAVVEAHAAASVAGRALCVARAVVEVRLAAALDAV